MCCDGNARGCIGVGVGGDIADVRAVGFLRVVADFEIAAWGVVRFHAAGRDPLQIEMRRDRGVRFIQVGVDIGVAWEGVCLRAVGEIVDVFGADDVDEFEGGLGHITRLRLRLILIRRLGLGGRSSGC